MEIPEYKELDLLTGFKKVIIKYDSKVSFLGIKYSFRSKIWERIDDNLIMRFKNKDEAISFFLKLSKRSDNPKINKYLKDLGYNI